MKLHISKDETTTGMLRKKTIYQMNVYLEMSPAEVEAAKKADIWDAVVIVYMAITKIELDVKVKSIATGRGWKFESDNTTDIALWEKEIRDVAPDISAAVKNAGSFDAGSSDVVEL